MIRGAKQRSLMQRFVTDPLVAVLVLIFWAAFKIMPAPMASWMGGRVGLLAGLLWRSKNKTALFNLNRAFPEKTDAERRQILRGMWIHFGRVAGEMPHTETVLKHIQYQNFPIFEQMRDDSKGKFLFSAHLGNWEVIGALAKKLSMRIHAIYRAANNPWLEKFVFSNRNMSDGSELLPKGSEGARRMIALLRQGDAISLLTDQKLREGMMVPFFGYPAPTADAMAILAVKMGLAIYSGKAVRIKGIHYRMTAYPPIIPPATGDRDQDASTVLLQVNQMIEGWIRETPEQWLWIHHRWKKSEYK